jgi:glycosyltransferase involved in cell wall biosynthesis
VSAQADSIRDPDPQALADRERSPLVSVIIPLHRDGPRFRFCLERCLAMRSSASYEVLVVADALPADLPKQVRPVATGSREDTSPAVKRDAAERVARGSILAFIDDDAYPAEDWLDRALKVLDDPSVHAVGGPGLTPPGSSWRERLGGAVYESRAGSGPFRRRFVGESPARAAEDLPAYNFVVRRDALRAVGGWGSTFYGGEDTKLCLALVKGGFLLRYDPRVRVYHFRRPILLPHLRQVGNVGRHRGFFVRRYPETSRKLVYFLPAVAAPGIVVVFAALLLAAGPVAWILSGTAWAAATAASWRRTGPASIAFLPVLLLHHLSYGLNFVRGLFGRPLTF